MTTKSPALVRLDLTHQVVLDLLDNITRGRFDGKERLLKGQAKLIAEGMRENLKAAEEESAVSRIVTQDGTVITDGQSQPYEQESVTND